MWAKQRSRYAKGHAKVLAPRAKEVLKTLPSLDSLGKTHSRDKVWAGRDHCKKKRPVSKGYKRAGARYTA